MTFRQEKDFRSNSINYIKRPALTYYGCGKSGYTKIKCYTYNPPANSASTPFENIEIHSLLTPAQSSIIILTIKGVSGTAYADRVALSWETDLMITVLDSPRCCKRHRPV
ncbi:hypothetical protein NPIL_447681 [Nephila pilipes]|uniref:Uncharacterized protein n=1 Tax=Nephila pilipes TaxID=299642 RepID=A0A8X6N6U1_NEPPI|nr:hypothetical protein NPIL_447681 [Nephila pilipes]